MQTLTDIRIYTNALRYKGEDITAVGVHHEGDNIIVRTSDGSVVKMRLPMGVCECEVQPMPEAVPACEGGSATNVLGSVLAGAMLLDEDVMEQLGRIPELEKMIGTHNKEVRFFCIEPVTVKVGEVEHHCEANQVATVFVGDDEFEIIPTSNRSIQSLLGYPIPLKWHDWLEGVEVFDGIVFDMNELETCHHWIQYYQGDYHVQKAQYANCVFWSDKPYTHSPFEERTNYTLYYSSQLPLCYSRIPENTYKPFYLAYGVTSDPNWRNPDYVNSYANVSGATQTFSYYGATAIGIFDMGVDIITLPRDCRGLMFHAPAITHAGVFDAKNTTNFGAKKGSWQEAFGDCISLTSLYIQNLKTSINISWSPINVESIEYIIENAANTTSITISVSPYTWYRLPEAYKATALAKKITIALLEGNYYDDVRFTSFKTINGQSIIGSGDITIEGGGESVDLSDYYTKTEVDAKGFLTNIPEEYVTVDELPAAVTERTVAGWGFTKNMGTVTGVRMNGVVKGNSGIVDLGTVITAHQEVSAVAKSGDYTDLINAPTEIATATERRVMTTSELLLRLDANILYDYSMVSLESLTLPSLSTGDSAYDNVWMVRCALLSSDTLTIPFDVKWKDGVAPSFSSWSILDLTFRKTPNETIIGEWKIYK